MALKRYYLVRPLAKRKAPVKPPKGSKKAPPKRSKTGGQ